MTRTKPIWWLISLLLTTIGWVVASAIFIAIFEFPRWVNINTGIIYLIFMWFTPGAIGGLITVTAMRIVIPGIQWKQALFVTIGWVIGWVIGGAIIVATIGRDIGGIVGFVIGYGIGWAIAGAIGGGVMFLVFHRAKQSV